MPEKPLGRKAYGSIPHLPGSYMDDSDGQVDPGLATICLVKARKWDHVIVLEKLDGTNVAVARIGGEIVPLIRAGYRAADAYYPMHHMFHRWVMRHAEKFAWLQEGERISGEWLAQAHGTRYDLRNHQPFIAFDIFSPKNERWLWRDVVRTCDEHGIETVQFLAEGPISIEAALAILAEKGVPTLDGDLSEGLVYRVETKPVSGKKEGVNFLAKYVRPGRVVGGYLPGIGERANDAPPIWNWVEEVE